MMKTMKLKDIATLITKGTTPTSIGFDFQNEGINFVKIECIDENGGFVSEKFDHISFECNEKLKRSQLQENDILFSIAGAIGRTAIVNKSIIPANTNQALAIIRIPKGKINYSFLLYALKSSTLLEQAEKKKQGVAQLNLSLKDIGDFIIPDIPVEQQEHIACVLDKINELIHYRMQQLQKLDELVKARFVEMFDLQKCKRKPLGECTNFVDYRGHTPELSETGTIRMINAKSVGKGFFKYVDEYVTEETYDSWMHRGFGYPGDILFVTEGHTFGNTCAIPNNLKKFALGQRVITIQGHQELSNAFLCSYMQTDMFWKDINVYRTGGTAQGIRSKDLIKVCVPVPSIELQKQFAAFVEQVDKSKFVVQKALDEAQTLFDSLMQEYFG